MTNTTEKNYNGWTNYETWNVKLWMDNSQGDQEYWRDRALNLIAISLPTEYSSKEDNAIYDLSDEIKESFEGQAQEIMEKANASASPFMDLLNASLSEVNWREIAESLIEDAKG